MVTVCGVGWSVVCFFFGTAPYLPPWLYRRRQTAVLTVTSLTPQLPLLCRKYRQSSTATAAAIPAFTAELSSPPSIFCFLIATVAPLPLSRLQLRHRGSNTAVAPLFSPLGPSRRNCHTTTAISAKLSSLSSICRLNIFFFDPSSLTQIHLRHFSSIAVVAPLSSLLHPLHRNRFATTANAAPQLLSHR